MSKGQLILRTTLIGALIGLIVFFSKPKYNIYRSQLEHLEGEANEVSQFWIQDKAIILPGTNITARVYSSYNKSLVKNTKNSISEVKIYIPDNIDPMYVYRKINEYVIGRPIKHLNFKKQGEIKEWNTLLAWIALGFIVGLIINFILTFKRKAQENE